MSRTWDRYVVYEREATVCYVGVVVVKNAVELAASLLEDIVC
jgi:hypothetical protein